MLADARTNSCHSSARCRLRRFAGVRTPARAMRRSSLPWALTLALEIDDEVDLGLYVFLLFLCGHPRCDANVSRGESKVGSEEDEMRTTRERTRARGPGQWTRPPCAIHVTFATHRARQLPMHSCREARGGNDSASHHVRCMSGSLEVVAMHCFALLHDNVSLMLCWDGDLEALTREPTGNSCGTGKI